MESGVDPKELPTARAGTTHKQVNNDTNKLNICKSTRIQINN